MSMAKSTVRWLDKNSALTLPDEGERLQIGGSYKESDWSQRALEENVGAGMRCELVH